MFRRSGRYFLLTTFHILPHTCIGGGIVVTTKPIMIGDSQVICLPDEFRLPDEELFLNRAGDTIILTPVSRLRSSFAEALAEFTPDFMTNEKPPQTMAKEAPL